METTHLRPATAADVERIRAVVAAAYTPYVTRLGGEPMPMHDDHAQQVDDGLITVAERGGEIVGLIVLERHPDHVLVENVAVDPAAHGTGVGRALLVHAEQQGSGEVRLYTHELMTENQALYERIGYVETHRSDVRVFYAKRLTS